MKHNKDAPQQDEVAVPLSWQEFQDAGLLYLTNITLAGFGIQIARLQHTEEDDCSAVVFAPVSVNHGMTDEEHRDGALKLAEWRLEMAKNGD